MEPNQNNQNVEPVSNSDIVFRDKPKSNKGMVIGMVCLAILALGGIGFGIWAMMDGNTQKTQLNSRIDTLEQQKNELEKDNSELETVESVDQTEIADDEEVIEEDEEELEEEGYRIISIGDCIADGGTAASAVMIIKCDAETSEGNGKFVYDSESNTLKFILNQ